MAEQQTMSSESGDAGCSCINVHRIWLPPIPIAGEANDWILVHMAYVSDMPVEAVKAIAAASDPFGNHPLTLSAVDSYEKYVFSKANNVRS